MAMLQSGNMYDGMSIYVCTDVLPFFAEHVLPHIRHSFTLVSGDSDARVPHGHIDLWNGAPKVLSKETCLSIANSPLLVRWFAQNFVFVCDKDVEETSEKVFSELTLRKLFQLPVGLDYHTIYHDRGKFWRAEGESCLPRAQESYLLDIRKTMLPFDKRIPKIFVHMTNGANRQKDLDLIPAELYDFHTEKMPRTQVWKSMARYSFVFSPYGNSPDCHRFWEALCLGCIPIVRSFGENDMMDDLPVLVVKEWSDVTAELLDNTLASFRERHFHYDKLLLRYWIDRIHRSD
jgi:hypothetical protein